MRIFNTTLEGVKRIELPIFEDFRGEYIETWNRENYKVFDVEFQQDDISTSQKGTFRGIHGDQFTTKLVSCLVGRIWLVVLNAIEGHKEYGKWESFIISESNRQQILIPPKFANGHLALTDCMFHYKQNTLYGTEGSDQFTIKFNDPRFGIELPFEPVTSERDKPICLSR